MGGRVLRVFVTLVLLLALPMAATAQEPADIGDTSGEPAPAYISTDPGDCTGAGNCAPGGHYVAEFWTDGDNDCEWHVTIDWGDDAAPEQFTYTTTGANVHHQYREPGRYSLVVTGSGTPLRPGWNCVYHPSTPRVEVPATTDVSEECRRRHETSFAHIRPTDPHRRATGDNAATASARGYWVNRDTHISARAGSLRVDWGDGTSTEAQLWDFGADGPMSFPHDYDDASAEVGRRTITTTLDVGAGCPPKVERRETFVHVPEWQWWCSRRGGIGSVMCQEVKLRTEAEEPYYLRDAVLGAGVDEGVCSGLERLHPGMVVACGVKGVYDLFNTVFGHPEILERRDADPSDPGGEDQVPCYRCEPGVYPPGVDPRNDPDAVPERSKAQPHKEGGVDRLAGPSRFDTAAAAALQRYPEGTATVVVASGRGFADALSGGPLAGLWDAPMLLTEPTFLPAATTDAVSRLRPSNVVVVGGRAVVSPEVLSALATLVEPWGGTVTRLAGENRYATALQALRRFGGPVPALFVASGADFPDALSATAAAVAYDAPVLLVDPAGVPLDAAAYLRELAPEEIWVVGGRSAVPDLVVAQLQAATGAPAVARLSGATRFDTSAVVAATLFLGTPYGVVATGTGFPDALAAGVLAGSRSAPLYLVAPDQVPELTAAYLDALPPSRLTILGGPNAIGPAVEAQLRALAPRQD